MKSSSHAARTARRPVPVTVKIAYTAYVAAVVPVYWMTYTPWNFLYVCDIALLVTAVALWLESPLLVGMEAVAITVTQLLWVVDLLCRLLAGVHVTGVTAYMADATLPLVTRLLSTFHGWLPFFLLWLPSRLRYDRRALAAQSAAAVATVLASYFLAPAPPPPADHPHWAVNINYVHGLDDAHPQPWMPPTLWLVVLTAFNIGVLYLPPHLALRRLSPPPVRPARLALDGARGSPCPHRPLAEDPPPPDSRPVREPEAAQRHVGDGADRDGGRVGDDEAVHVAGVDGARGDQPIAHEVQERSPVLDADEDEREFLDLVGLNEGRRLEDLVERAESSG